MSSNPSIILLDSVVVAGVFAVTKEGKDFEKRKLEWRRATSALADKLIGETSFIVPTPVCFELACWNKAWRSFVLSEKNPLFRYAGYSISSDILNIASLYSIEGSTCFYDGKQHKIKSFDPVIAAYSLKFNYHLITTNQKDFPESHFEIVSSEIVLLNEHDGSLGRTFLYLLKPKKRK